MKEQKRDNRKGFQRGSAFILAIVLTSLLAVIGVMFVMITRVDRIATSAIAENKALDGAVETIIAKISQQLILDTPGVANPTQEYYDYPDANSDPWLASLEPYKDGSNYKWRWISDIDANNLEDNAEDVNAQIVNDYQGPSGIGDSNDIVLFPADADGDGVSDSVWIKLDGVMTTKGEPIYAAVRVVDNSGMLNVNTAYQFDPNTSDGSSQTQIDLETLSERGTGNSLNQLDTARYGDESGDMDDYIKDVVWQYDTPDGNYTPFDIGDELKLRNRYILNYNRITTRIEKLWAKAFDWGAKVPRDSNSLFHNDPNYWFWYANNSSIDINDYDYRHIATTYNMDRIINPDGGRLVNVNNVNTIADIESLYLAIMSCLDFVDANEIAAQIIANLIDYVDSDDNDNVTDINSVDVNDPNLAGVYYGFERPCVYISELTFSFYPCEPLMPGDPNHRSYAIELYKPYCEDNDPNKNNWELLIDGTPYDVNWLGTGQFHVIRWEDPNLQTLLPVDFNDYSLPSPPDKATGVPTYTKFRWVDSGGPYDVYFGENSSDVNESATPVSSGQAGNTYDPGGLSNNETLYYWRIDDREIWSFTTHKTNPEPNDQGDPFGEDKIFNVGDTISLVRDVGGVDIVVDSVDIPNWLVNEPTPAVADANSYQRDITRHKCIRRLWAGSSNDPNLGHHNRYMYAKSPAVYIQAHPSDSPFTNVGEIGKIFYKNVYNQTVNSEQNWRLDLNEPNFQQLFNYLTVMDPYNHISDPNETRVKGRININTAPWFVLAQLPWVSEKGYGLAEEIVEKRDELEGFKNIGQLCSVVAGDPNDSIDYYSRNDGDAAGDQMGFPDLTGGDGAVDDFEERDLIFARISNLVTVRSDVFTAYILVRAGVDGAQKRVIAILDRSNVYSDSAGGVIGDVKIRALHPVPDPR